MAAGLGLKTFVTGDVLTAADTNGYLMQGVWVFASAAARTSAVTSPQEGNFSFLKDTNSTEYYDGAAWVAVSGGSITLISSTAMTGSATITLSSIPQTYTNLLLVYTGAYSAGAFDNIQYRMNTDSGTNYDYNFIGTSGTSGDFANAIQGTAGQLGSSTNLTNAYDKASGVINIYNYAQTSVPVVCTSYSRTNYGGTIKGATGNIQYRNSAAITSFSIIASSSFSGGTIKLYGVK